MIEEGQRTEEALLAPDAGPERGGAGEIESRKNCAGRIPVAGDYDASGLTAHVVGEGGRQTLGDLQFIAGSLIYAHGADVVKQRSWRRIKDAAADLEQLAGFLQRAAKKLLLIAAEGRRRAGRDHGITDLFDRVQGRGPKLLFAQKRANEK